MNDLPKLIARLRYVMLAACLGGFVGALLLFGVGLVRLGEGVGIFFSSDGLHGESVPVRVLEAVDSLLFGVVLMIFAFGIAFGLVFDLSDEFRARLPEWMRIDNVAELKHTLVEVVLVVLVVDFARSVVEADDPLTWQALILPISILLIAAALRLFSHPGKDKD